MRKHNREWFRQRGLARLAEQRGHKKAMASDAEQDLKELEAECADILEAVRKRMEK